MEAEIGQAVVEHDGHGLAVALTRRHHAFGPSHAIFEAVARGHLDAVQLLCDTGSDVNAFCPTLQASVLQHAMIHLSRGCMAGSVLFDSPGDTMRMDVVRLLLHRGADVNRVRDVATGDSALHILLKIGAIWAVTTFLENGANVNHQNSDGDVPLHLVVHNYFQAKRITAGLQSTAPAEQAELIDSLLRYGADPTVCNAQGRSPLTLAAALDQDDPLGERMMKEHLWRRRRLMAWVASRSSGNVVAQLSPELLDLLKLYF